MLYSHFVAHLAPVLERSQPQRLAVAYSGGLDSQVLLHLIYRARQVFPQHTYQAVHIHHGLSANADDWLAHCQYWASQWQLDFLSRRVHVSTGARQSTEASARAARYQAFSDCLAPHTHLLLAQHQDDQLETVLLQLKRGSGPRGLSGMSRLSQRWQLNLHRPMLDCRRQQILDYARHYQLTWVEDESNQDQRYDRNFLRQAVLPAMLERWPDLSRTVSRSAELCAEQQALLDEVTEQYLQQLRVCRDQLDGDVLQQYSDAWVGQIIRFWLNELQVAMPPRELIRRLRSELLLPASDATPCLEWNGYQLRRFRGRVFFCVKRPQPEPWHKAWHGQEDVDVGDGRVLTSGDNASLGVTLFNEGDFEIGQGSLNQSFRPEGAQHSKPLKQWLKRWDVPPWERPHCIWLRRNGCIEAVWLTDRAYQVAVDEGGKTVRIGLKGGNNT